MDLLRSPIRHYAWGSRSAIAQMQGRAFPTAEPEAELWVGAHPTAPAHVERGEKFVGLDEVIAADPETVLGTESLQRFGARLPYLLKVLAAAEPLSIQVHPTMSQAAEGYARENAASIPVDSPQRNYVDASHKPELLVALTPFEALCGFREPNESASLLADLGIPELKPYVDALQRADGLVRAARRILTAPDAVDAARALGDACSVYTSDSSFPLALVGKISARYRADIGVLMSALMNPVRLNPGEGLFVEAGVLHAYIRGTGVEVMASSDNVLRAGLTPKHVDVGELARIVDYCPMDVHPLGGEEAEGIRRWPTSAEEFVLQHFTIAGEPRLMPLFGPRIVLCVDGDILVRAGNTVDEVMLRAGYAAFICDADGQIELSGHGSAFAVAPRHGL